MNSHMDHASPSHPQGHIFACLVCAGATLIGLPFRASLNPENAAMLYLVGIALAATRYGRTSSTLAAIISAASYNFFFTQPYYSFRIDNTRDMIATSLLLVTSVIIGTLAARLRASALERVKVANVAEKNKMEAEGEKLRNALLSAVSHDFRSPLASIKGVISSLMMEDNHLQQNDVQELLSSAHGEVARLERIVSNLLEVTLLESGKLKPNKDYYFLPELVGNALKQVETQLQGRVAQCHLHTDLPALYVDGLLIEQVLVNLLENATKYTPPGTPITIYGDSNGDHIAIVVEDQGRGIPAGEEEKIFEPFHTSNTLQPRKGSGLGLAICQGIVHIHSGSIHYKNRSGGGAVFTILLPADTIPSIVADV